MVASSVSTKTKIVTAAALKRKLPGLRGAGKKIAFTNGCFDILHAGHVSYLEKAKKSSRILVVGLNSDRSIRRIKGPKRPINPQTHRARVLAALTCVDFVVLFNTETPYQLIKALQPDILIKGADWKAAEVVGSDVVKARGGKIELLKYVSNCSTTNIIKTILKKCKK